MIIPRYDQWSNLELEIGERILKWSINCNYGRFVPVAQINQRIHIALLALIRAERARRSLPST